ncbi:protein-tyrosine sulfotransferase-like [Ostrinia furnacalis]|uniref:protein-tyrosine sulfotransferase-like n=1 Tax=Ostrinia furnacalis TaxID=93504 RepID=UPI00103E89AC|nr:protein-tyrosine sulfotransferase-like [Ostrinia furnacalis]XP_028164747.1 protein-tyrosine sulfotransferase-like [Ostrinia furnacalis]XP_028164748.1 protein-tyrosine sulfotransferase-like [Ostrinia furnacalis]XP_028164749.1 protein-tyrosine sulfotransferase-like [Ostrinia furnacalis]XP_028164750.1 protein-tyrosine sulfotransferase-like [Ostrinia furnacalis]XP_028164751.1 protein-tyrosine sulfotransferase-like [Ostrinia furnacalis]XP_028164752.1 protein-tyrosine sulfotransferase-like [Ostr
MWRGARWRLGAALALGALLLWAWRGGPGGPGAAVYGRAGGAAPVAGRELPLIFIGGVPRSGTTLMRAMLDAHPDVRCGQETRVVPRILQMRQHWARSQKESVRLEQAGVSKAVLDNAIAAFCLEVIVRHGDPAPRLCNKDPLVLKMGTYVLELFPNAKFLFMVRDGRATVHSIITRKVTITGFDLSSYRQCLTKWNHAVELMYQQCKALGSDKCLLVRYEALVLRPEETLRRVLGFLGLPWDEAVLHHERYINQPGGVALSNVERSSDQVVRPVNRDALDKWVGQLPADVRADMAELAPMLSVLGYDPWANPPRYDALPAHRRAPAPASPPPPPPP